MCLTLRAAGSPDVSVRGPGGPGGGSGQLFDSVRHFIQLKDFEVRADDADRPYKDSTLCVESVRIESSGPDVVPEKLDCQTWGVQEQDLRPIDQTALSYVISVRGKPGRLLMDKCVALGVPKGPLLGMLKAGKDVTLDDGRIVSSAEVTAQPSPDQICLVVDCPTENHLQSFLDASRLNRDLDDKSVPFVFHFTPLAVLRTKEYKGWMDKFPADSTTHVVLNEACVDFSSKDVLAYQKKLRNMAPDLFPSLEEVNRNEINQFSALDLGSSSNLVVPSSGQRFGIRPTAGVEENGTQNDTDDQDSDSIFHPPNDFPSVTFLGTGASIPSKYRCVSGIFVRSGPDRCFVLDCGEGTYQQLARNFGSAAALDLLTKLKLVYVSHLHADHHLGLINLLLQRRRAIESSGEPFDRAQTLYLAAPGRISYFLTSYHAEFEPILSGVRLVRNEQLLLTPDKCKRPPPAEEGERITKTPKFKDLSAQEMSDMLSRCSFSRLDTCRVEHCAGAFGVSIVDADGYKMVYSGDTRPCQELVSLGRSMDRPPDLLIHEATMGQDLQQDAEAKRHSTFTEALQVAKQMQAQFTILTHFSQRYSKVLFIHLEAE